MPSEPNETPKSLWKTMGVGGDESASADAESREDEDSSPDDPSAATGSDEVTSQDGSGAHSTSPLQPGITDASRSTAEPPDPSPTSTSDARSVRNDPADDSAAGKSLWTVMAGSPSETESPQDTAAIRDRADDDVSSPGTTAGVDAPLSDDEFIPISHEGEEFFLSHSSDESVGKPRFSSASSVLASGRSRAARISFALGALTLPIAALGMLPEFWLTLPATMIGFLALVIGLTALGEIHRSRGRVSGKGFAIAGLSLGVIGMFLGPTLFAQFGESLRNRSGRALTQQRLESIGESLDTYYEDRNAFPAGGRFRVDDDGEETPMHGWMTELLPHMGYETLYNRIEFDQPYDSATNSGPMSRVIPEFHAAGATRQKTARGLGVSHYSGVGGEAIDEKSGLVDLGIFDRNRSVRRDDITDGLSQTLIVGEIAHTFPAWGAPDNWRQIGRGLNRDMAGFGNAEGTGAHFLKADGSVEFFSNQTAPEVLRQLCSRNGGPVHDTESK